MGAPGKSMERMKTDLRLSYKLVKHVEEAADRLGVPKNAFFAMAAAELLVKLSTLQAGRVRRKKLLDDLEREFSQRLAAAREAS